MANPHDDILEDIRDARSRKALEVAPALWRYRKMVENSLAKTRKKLAGK